jgi:hypothetical protein
MFSLGGEAFSFFWAMKELFSFQSTKNMDPEKKRSK